VSVSGRVTDYDSIASRFDRRYSLYEYAGVRDSILSFLGDTPLDVLEVGCGTGHWLTTIERSVQALAERNPRRLVGLEPSMPMLEVARRNVGQGGRVAMLTRGAAERLPFLSASFDRIVCINALHHFKDRRQFFAEARRVLRLGGGVMTIGKDPFAERDGWWVYDYFPETRDIDRARFAPVRILRGELANAGFTWAESFEADHIELTHSASEALATGVVDRAFTSQLTVLSDQEFAAGAERLRAANAAADGQLQLVTDFFLFATVGWLTA
jgi:SAM-dependent methyltransferase